MNGNERGLHGNNMIKKRARDDEVTRSMGGPVPVLYSLRQKYISICIIISQKHKNSPTLSIKLRTCSYSRSFGYLLVGGSISAGFGTTGCGINAGGVAAEGYSCAIGTYAVSTGNTLASLTPRRYLAIKNPPIYR